MNKSKFKIGIVGLGYVGKAVEMVFKKKCDIFSYDINCTGNSNNLLDVATKSDYIFICLPTPMNDDGSCNTKIIDLVLEELNDNCNKFVIIKSTIPPGTSKSFSDRYKNIKIIYNPEFLTESNYLEDFKTQNRIILGGISKYVNNVKTLYLDFFPNAKIVFTTYEESEMIKYFTNTFLATKVSFANEIYSLCEKMNISYDIVVENVLLDKRIGNSHFNVPGPDGKIGFGGSCLPKDLKAMINLFKSQKINSEILESVWNKNLKVRKENDWEKLKGRAVNKD